MVCGTKQKEKFHADIRTLYHGTVTIAWVVQCITCILQEILNTLTAQPYFATIARIMSQERLIKLVSKGDANGVGKNHVYYTTYNNKNKKDPTKKYATKK